MVTNRRSVSVVFPLQGQVRLYRCNQTVCSFVYFVCLLTVFRISFVVRIVYILPVSPTPSTLWTRVETP